MGKSFNGKRKRNPWERKERSLSETGVRLQPRGNGIIVAQLDPSMDSVEKFLSAYFQAQKQAEEYIAERIRIEKELSAKFRL